jgi:hypothetical protein
MVACFSAVICEAVAEEIPVFIDNFSKISLVHPLIISVSSAQYLVEHLLHASRAG